MRRLALCLLLLGVLVGGFCKSDIPPAPNPPRLVNDFAGVIPSAQVDDMEHRLVAFNDSTSNVICVVTVDDLGHYSAAQFAYEIGDQWGVRSKDKRNGVVILIKPRNSNGGGEVYISVGYDLEGAIPDAIAKRIIEQKMIPELKEEKYGDAIDSALAYILPLAAGEISARYWQSVFEQIRDMVLTADLGMVDIAWLKKDARSKELAQAMEDRKKEREELENDFKQFLKESGQE